MLSHYNSCDATEPSNLHLGRLVNHGRGKHQNARMKVLDINGAPILCLFSLKGLKKDEEVLYDYGIKNLPWLHNAGKLWIYFEMYFCL